MVHLCLFCVYLLTSSPLNLRHTHTYAITRVGVLILITSVYHGIYNGGSLEKYLNGKMHKVQIISFVLNEDQFFNFKSESYSFVLLILKNLVIMTGLHVTI